MFLFQAKTNSSPELQSQSENRRDSSSGEVLQGVLNKEMGPNGYLPDSNKTIPESVDQSSLTQLKNKKQDNSVGKNLKKAPTQKKAATSNSPLYTMIPTVIPSARQEKIAQMKQREEEIRQNKPKGMNRDTYLKLSDPKESAKAEAKAKFSNFKKGQAVQLRKKKGAKRDFNTKVAHFERNLIQRKIDYGSEQYDTLLGEYFPGFESQQRAPQQNHTTVQKKQEGDVSRTSPTATPTKNNTGLPDNLKSGIENLSGHSMDDVKVHYNSDKPAQLDAHAYAQGSDIHLSSGQEMHLPHEAWHVVQQKQGRVKPTMQMKGKININDDTSLEREADVMGAKAASITPENKPATNKSGHFVLQQKPISGFEAVLQGKMKAKNFRELITEQTILQTEVKSNPDKYEESYTTAGFEHEFADMATGALRGASHIEIAKSVEKMPYTGLRFILETDAQNALEFVSPPFLVETLPGVPLPDPDDVEQIDNMIEDTLVRHSSSKPSLRELIYKLGDDPGLTFRTGNLESEDKIDSHEFPKEDTEDRELKKPLKRPEIQGDDVKIHRENMSGVTEGKIRDRDITRRNNLLSKDALLDIELQPFDVSAGSKKVASSQVNFASDAKTYDMMQSLSSSVKDGTEHFVDLENAFRLEFYNKAFKKDLEGKSKERIEVCTLYEGVSKVADSTIPIANESFHDAKSRASFKETKDSINFWTKRVRTTERNFRDAIIEIKSEITSIKKELMGPYDLASSIAKGEKLTHSLNNAIQSADSNINALFEEEEKDPVGNGLKGNVKDYDYAIDQANDAASKLSGIGEGKGDDNLKIFLNSLSRKLAGQLGVNAQKIMKDAQKRRFKKAYAPEEGKIGGKDIGKSGMLSSRVKDVHQVWIKDTILNIGLGLLDEDQWGRVKTLIQGTKSSGSFMSKYVGGIRESIKSMKLPVKFGGDFPSQKDYTNLVDNALKQIVTNIKEFGLDDLSKKSGIKKRRKAMSGGVFSIGPSKRPDLFDHDPKLIGARQDTYIPAKHVQMPGIWKDKRLHVVESRGNMEEMIKRMRKMQEIYKSGGAYSAFSSPSFDYEDFMKKNLEEGDEYLENGYILKKAQADKLRSDGYENVNTVPDGDCLFNSLITIGAHAGDLSAFRNEIADRIEDDTVNVTDFGLNKDTTVADIRKLGSYNNLAGDVTSSIIANVLNVKIIIYNENGSTTTLDGGAGGPYRLIRFTSPGAHYHATGLKINEADESE